MSDVGKPEPPPGLRPPRFRLLTLMLAVTLVGVVLAAGQAVGVYGTFWIVVFALAVVAHVAGNSLGMQLRDSSPAGRSSDEEYPRHLPRPGSSVHAENFAPASKLSQRRSLGWLVLAVTLAGFVTTAAVGGFWLTQANWHEATWMSIVCSGLASGTLGAFGGFLVASFLKVLIESVWEASRHECRPGKGIDSPSAKETRA